MSDVLIRTKAPRAQVMEFLRSLPGVLSGRLPDRYGVSAACQAALIHAALEDVYADFGRKSSGNTGDDGLVWEPLHPYTIRRRSLQKGLSGQPGRKPLTNLDYQWLRQSKRDIYYRELRRLLAGGVPIKEAQRQASITSRFLSKGVWQARNKALGKQGTPGAPAGPEDFPILDDTGRLKESVAAGSLAGEGLNAQYHEAGREGGDQTVTYGKGFVQADSGVPYGDAHMRPGKGSRTGGYRPARPWKYPDEVPPEWIDRWAEVYATNLQKCVVEVIQKL